MGVWGRRGAGGCGIPALGVQFLARKPADGILWLARGAAGGSLFLAWRGDAPFPVFLADEEAVGGEPAAAVVGGHGELAGGDQIGQDLADTPVGEADAALDGGLAGDPFAVGIAVAGDGDEDEQVGSALAGVLPDGGNVVKAHEQVLHESVGRARHRSFPLIRGEVDPTGAPPQLVEDCPSP